MVNDDVFWYCSLPMKKGILDNDYAFLNDGRIIHCYDRTINKLNIEETISPNNIPERDKDQIIDSCPPEKKEIIARWLYPKE